MEKISTGIRKDIVSQEEGGIGRGSKSQNKKRGEEDRNEGMNGRKKKGGKDNF